MTTVTGSAVIGGITYPVTAELTLPEEKEAESLWRKITGKHQKG
jgi:hypothetical protein